MKLYEYLKKILLGTDSIKIGTDSIKKKFETLLENVKDEKIKIEFIKPNLNTEISEIERVQKEFDLTNAQVDEIKKNFNKQKLVDLKYDEIDNSDFSHVKTIDDVIKLATEYGKNIDALLTQFNNGKIEAPIILSIGKNNPHLIGGNTRLMVLKIMLLKSLNVKIKVLEIKL